MENKQLKDLFYKFFESIDNYNESDFLNQISLNEKITLFSNINEYKNSVYIYMFLKSKYLTLDKNILKKIKYISDDEFIKFTNEEKIDEFDEKYQKCIDVLNKSIANDIENNKSYKKK